MSLQQQLSEDLKTAMKAKDALRRDAIRMVSAAMKNKAVELGRGPQGELSDEEVQAVLATEVKKRKDAATAYRDAGREELAAKEDAEAEVYAGYLPEQLSDDELGQLVDEVVAETGASSMKDMGATIKEVLARAEGRVEGARVSQAVKARLAG